MVALLLCGLTEDCDSEASGAGRLAVILSINGSGAIKNRPVVCFCERFKCVGVD